VYQGEQMVVDVALSKPAEKQKRMKRIIFLQDQTTTTTKMKILLLVSVCACSSGFIAQYGVGGKSSFTRRMQAKRSSRFPLAFSTSRDQGNASSKSIKAKTSLPASTMADPEDGPRLLLKETLSNATVPFPSTLASSPASFNVQLDDNSWDPKTLADNFMNSYIGPRILLAAVACLYGTNFPLGSIMDEALPASAATSSRMVLAAIALSPFISQLPRELIGMSLLAGCFTASGYVTQSMALVDTSPATVSFLGAATVIWCPFLEWLVHRTPMGWRDRPQTWISAAMCMLGVGILELGGAANGADGGMVSVGWGDGLSILQAMGFGTGLFLSEQMMKKHPTKALSITSVMLATTAFLSMIWALSDGWIGSSPGWESMTLPRMFLDPSMQQVAMAVAWTGILSTSLNFFLEVFALGRVPSGEASVILASEPLWAAAFASILLGEEFGWNDYTGGFLIVSACIVNSMKLSDVQRLLPSNDANSER
jgi:drug/metabolite transporter (DMT)-like permease